MGDSGHGRWRVAVLVLGLLAGTATYTAAVLLTHDRSPVAQALAQRRTWEVARDDGATVQDIVEVGEVTDVDRSGDHHLVVYSVDPGDDEGPHAKVWAVYDGDGDRIAAGRGTASDEASPYLVGHAVPDGFLLGRQSGGVPEHVALDGSLSAVEVLGDTPTEPGDTAVLDQVYRPGDDGGPGVLFSLDRPDGMPGGEHRVVVDGTGGVWMMAFADRKVLEVFHSADGQAPWTTYMLRPPRVTYPRGLGIAGDRVVVVLARPRGVHSVRVRRIDEPPSAEWEQIHLGADTEDPWYAGEVGRATDGRTLLTAHQGTAFALDLDSGEHEVVRPPWRLDGGWTVDQSAGHLVATHATHPGAWTNDDADGDWAKLPR